MSQPPPFLPMMEALIGTPSVSSTDPTLDMSNRAAAELVGTWLDATGFDCRFMPVSDDGGKVNVIGVLGEGEGGLVLSGHLDTVPFDEHLWSSSPFELKEVDGVLRGLGVADMKSFFPLVIEALREIPVSELKRPIIVLGTADEETTMGGARALVAAGGIEARHAVIGEPTCGRPVRQHKGVMMERLRVIGQSGHSSDPSLGRNAIVGTVAVVAALLECRDDLARRFRNPAFQVSGPTLNVGHIHGGDNPNRIPGLCELHIDLRILPGMEIAEMRALLSARARTALEGSGLTLEWLPVFDGLPPLSTDADTEIVRAAEALTGSQAEAVSFGTEAPLLAQLGIQTIVMGPGDVQVAHRADEHLSLASIPKYIEQVRGLIRRLCVDV
jgi:acetylornithine deacetylase